MFSEVKNFNALIIKTEAPGIINNFIFADNAQNRFNRIAQVFVSVQLCHQYFNGSIYIGFGTVCINQFFITEEFIRCGQGTGFHGIKNMLNINHLTGTHVYINSGTLAGQADSRWTRRAKLKLASIPRQIVEAALSTQGGVIEARVAGTMADGGPVCASVKPHAVVWALVRDVA